MQNKLLKQFIIMALISLVLILVASFINKVIPSFIMLIIAVYIMGYATGLLDRINEIETTRKNKIKKTCITIRKYIKEKNNENQ